MANQDTYLPLVIAEAQAQGVDPALVASIVDHESGWDPNARNPSDPSYGLMQILAGPDGPASGYSTAQLLDPATNVHLGVSYLASQLARYGGDVASAVSAYNAGHATAGNQAYTNAVLGDVPYWQGVIDSVTSTSSPSADASSSPSMDAATPAIPAGIGGGLVLAVGLLVAFLFFGPKRGHA